MTLLAKGGNCPIHAQVVRVVVGWRLQAGTPDVDCTALLINAEGRVRTDDDMVFYNQPKHPRSSVTHEGKRQIGNQGYDAMLVDLTRVEPDVNRVVIVASADNGKFGQVPDLRATVHTAHDNAEMVRFNGMHSTTEMALVVGELYRKQGGWKFRAIGQGWESGLAGLAVAYGITVDDQPAAPPPAAPGRAVVQASPLASSAPGVRFTKGEDKLPAEDRRRLNLRKQQVLISLAKRGAENTTARVLVVLDASGSMDGLYKRGIVKKAVERMAAVAAQLDDDGTMQVWAFANSARQLPDMHVAEMPKWLKAQISITKFYDLGGGNNEPVVIEQVRRWVAANPANDPTLVLFFSDGGVDDDKEIERLLRDAAREPIFWQFIGLGRSYYGILERFDTLQGRVIDNVGFFSVDDIAKVPDADLYERLLSEFPSWIPEARRLGILR